MNKNAVLITGGTGFIGANLVRRLLDEGFEIYCVMRPDSNLWRLEEVKDQVKLLILDLLDEESVMREMGRLKPEYIFHLATYGSYPYQSDERKIFETNILGTVNLVNAAAKTGFKKMIVTGSSSEYGQKSEPMKESDVLEPNTAYGVSKAASTLYSQHRAREANFPILIFRPFTVYGPWEEETRLIPRLIKKCLSVEEELELVSSDIARDFVYVEDVVQAFLLALSNEKINGEIMNLASGRQSTIKDVMEMVEQVTKTKLKVHWREYAGRSFDTTHWVGDPAKTKSLLGWKAKTSLEEGIKKMIEWFKSNVSSYN